MLASILAMFPVKHRHIAQDQAILVHRHAIINQQPRYAEQQPQYASAIRTALEVALLVLASNMLLQTLSAKFLEARVNEMKCAQDPPAPVSLA
jgi:ethanolamine utilization protein EutP (predicted NTPase)